MKKIMIFASTLILQTILSCSKSEIGLTLDTDSVNMEYENYYQLVANAKDAKYFSENEYHASVDETGLVTANKIGSTNIVVSSKTGTVKVKIIVRPSYNLYPEPATDWKKTRSQIISQLGNPHAETDSAVSYLTDNSIYPMIIYEFDTNNMLKSSSVCVDERYASTLAKFLEERYVYAGLSNSTYVFYNGLDKGNINMSIFLSKISGYKLYLVMYSPCNLTKTDWTASNFEKMFKAPLELVR